MKPAGAYEATTTEEKKKAATFLSAMVIHKTGGILFFVNYVIRSTMAVAF